MSQILPCTILTIEQQIKLYNDTKQNNPQLLPKIVSEGIIDLAAITFYCACRAFNTNNIATQRVKDNAIKLVPRNEPVLITGESGTGKELLATILHGQRRGNFVAVNTCAITDTLFESELFGHERGAFTGADRTRNGLIKQTDSERGEQGTLFLDEIGDMPLSLQPKLLRMIQNRVYRPVGCSVDVEMKCRIVAATHQNLPTLVKEGRFRLDLYERLNVFKLHIPPLRERPEDIKLFCSGKLLDMVTKVASLNNLLPGNVRQLQNLQLRADVLGWESVSQEDLL